MSKRDSGFGIRDSAGGMRDAGFGIRDSAGGMRDSVRFRNFLENWTVTSHPTEGIKRFPRYEYLFRLGNVLTQNRLILVPKSRQMMASWTLCAWCLFRAVKGGLHLILSKNQFSADELLRRIKFIFDRLPGFLKLTTTVRSRSELEIKGMGRIISLPATDDAPRMHSPTTVFWDEMAFTPHSDKIWAALKPALDSGGAFIGVSTPNGAEDVFARLCGEAPVNGFHLHKIHWREHPERGELWAAEARKGLSETEWRREYEISFEGSSDLVYPEFTGNNVLDAPVSWLPGQPVFRAADFGYRHPFILWIMEREDGSLIVFDEWAGEDATVEQMMSAVHNIDSKHGLSESRVVFTACDPAGAAVDSQGISPVERMKRAGFKIRYRPSRILTGVEIVKSLLRDANGECKLFISPTLKILPRDFRRYRWRPDSSEPEKDGICDHSLDALRYFAVNYMYAPRERIAPARVKGWR
ncbi:hypothetical protein ISS30_01700 [bacterium]|nr:hypothetical protein [bacterium]